ncbi:MAG: hypothetical protein EKK65_04510 [Lysobacterales bacterium]|nr:MAG: hypothetical protein EKK65_04510 [Xanthomonadales bacterium]HNF65790.1 nucleotidyl transferase AbiEii/AbiGii toxin family protein [Plasticicumulans sp.]HNO59471.1 nucleotidyl transferase AbiEii/AbiGii toxin family protein [Plasticicumulans sp.]
MFEREHHRRIASVLAALDATLLEQSRCWFGGGTAIAMQLGEYRESVDIDFLCADRDGYRLLRSAVFGRGVQGLMRYPVRELRESRADQYGIRSVLEVEGVPIKFEIVREARIDLAGSQVSGMPVGCVDRMGLFAEKLLANVDRGLDRSTLSRDALDLIVMQQAWGDAGELPKSAWMLAESAYGDAIGKGWRVAIERLRDEPDYRVRCLDALDIKPDARTCIEDFLGRSRS